MSLASGDQIGKDEEPGNGQPVTRAQAADARIGRGRSPVAWALAGGALLAAALGSGVAHVPAGKMSATAGTPAGVPLALTLPGTRRPTYVLFQSGTSSLERQFLASLRPDAPPRHRDDLRVVLLSRMDGPIARRFGIRETPTLIVLEPGGNEISRRIGAQAITAALTASGFDSPAPPRAGSSAAAACKVWRGPRLRWVDEKDPQAHRVYRRFAGGQWGVPDIFKAMSLRPELMEKALDLSELGHFSDGYLDRRTKERIATFVSALNGSHYCIGSHAGGLREMRVRAPEIAALARGDLEAARLSPRDRALFEFVRRLTLKPGEMSDADITRLRALGWRDEQLFEAAFDASLFAFFNRVASAYGLDYPPDGWKPSSASTQGVSRPGP